jgi:hypothetical protein
MKADELGHLSLVEMTAHGVADLPVELGDGVGLREDRRTHCPSGEPTLGGLLDDENDLVHRKPTYHAPSWRETWGGQALNVHAHRSEPLPGGGYEHKIAVFDQVRFPDMYSRAMEESWVHYQIHQAGLCEHSKPSTAKITHSV